MNMRKISICFAFVLLLELFVPVGFSQTHSYVPKNGFIPNEKTAIAVADAVLAEIYGENQIKGEQPFTAKLDGGIWIVTGSLHTPNGGVAEIRISKKDGCILHVTHGK
jgi:hypothetical protein